LVSRLISFLNFSPTRDLISELKFSIPYRNRIRAGTAPHSIPQLSVLKQIWGLLYLLFCFFG